MADIKGILIAIDEFLEKRKQEYTTPVELNNFLEKKGLLKDNHSRPGLPIRIILRDGKIKQAYQVGSNWRIPHSGNIVKTLKIDEKGNVKPTSKISIQSSKQHKLTSIGKFVVDLIEKEYHINPEYSLEFKPEWLLSYPDSVLIEKYPELNELYSDLVESLFVLNEKLKELTVKKSNQKQSYDIWIGEPFNFAIEFDEKQHFNQFRYLTLNYYKRIITGFPIELYSTLNKDITIKPSTSGFTKLKSNDPLFPNFFEGINQDNRIRQRAFRDFLKDLLPMENNCRPTLRIPYQITNNKVSNFTDYDLKNIQKYIAENKLIK